MNRQVLPSMILSVLIVCCFSVLLYHREPPRSRPRPPNEAARPEPTSKASVSPAAPDSVAHVTRRVPEPSVAKPTATGATAPPTVLPGAGRDAAPPASSAVATSPSGPRSAFTTVQDGETLDDVSNRIYGSGDQADLLWRANRDLLPRRDSSLRSGAVLRTPERPQDG